MSAQSIVLRASGPQHDDDNDALVSAISHLTADSERWRRSDNPTASVPAIDHLTQYTKSFALEHDFVPISAISADIFPIPILFQHIS